MVHLTGYTFEPRLSSPRYLKSNTFGQETNTSNTTKIVLQELKFLQKKCNYDYITSTDLIMRLLRTLILELGARAKADEMSVMDELFTELTAIYSTTTPISKTNIIPSATLSDLNNM